MFEMSIRNKLSGLGGVCVGIGSLICIINLLIAPVANFLMRLGYQDKGIEDFYRQTFFKPGNYHREKPNLCLVTYSYSDKLVLRIQCFIK